MYATSYAANKQPRQTIIHELMTTLDHLLRTLALGAAHNGNDVGTPHAIIWPGGERPWEPVISRLSSPVAPVYPRRLLRRSPNHPFGLAYTITSRISAPITPICRHHHSKEQFGLLVNMATTINGQSQPALRAKTIFIKHLQ